MEEEDVDYDLLASLMAAHEVNDRILIALDSFNRLIAQHHLVEEDESLSLLSMSIIGELRAMYQYVSSMDLQENRPVIKVQ